ncbi:MAG: biotin--[acetyl-CoA-carboxylase] ligase [Bacteroidales bacterium]|nr:biotin--[acetyl-CoA-carboxylase] ligase [Bacteroidales bacterium]
MAQQNIISFDALNSTQTKLIELDKANNLAEFSVVICRNQTNGKGQQNNVWESQSGQNLTFSLLLRPDFLSTSRQFLLTKALSLGVADFLKKYIKPKLIRIKWPNDIYVKDSKICGILVFNNITGQRFDSAYCGIGVNINQMQFANAPNPTSLALETGRGNYDLELLLNELLDCLQVRYNALKTSVASISRQYLRKLYLLKTMTPYIYMDEKIEAKIIGVDKFGHLILEDKTKKIIQSSLKEIKFLQRSENAKY